MAIKAAAFNQGKYPTIAFVNLATEPLGTDLGKLVSALDKQMERDFVPIWGYPAKLYATQKPKPDEWQVVFLDDADAANALGYHDITKNGQPVSKVFVKTTIAAGQKVSVTASHELLEMMIDPGAQLWAQNANGRFYAYEMCDAVEEEEYEIDGIAVSDFVHPAFFEPWHEPRSTQFDHLGKVAQPFQTLQRGYQIVSDGKSVQEIFGSRAKEQNFRTAEIRTMHRSEYRKQTMLSARARSRSARIAANAPFDLDADMRTAHAAALHHAGRLLMALAAMVDPFPGDPFEPAERRKARGVIDPLPGAPFELAERRLVSPVPRDPWEL
jgi:hypothetical protein